MTLLILWEIEALSVDYKHNYEMCIQQIPFSAFLFSYESVGVVTDYRMSICAISKNHLDTSFF